MLPNDDLSPVLHRIRVKLYPNYLPNGKGKYIERAFGRGRGRRRLVGVPRPGKITIQH